MEGAEGIAFRSRLARGKGDGPQRICLQMPPPAAIIISTESTAKRFLSAAYAGSFHEKALFPVFTEFSHCRFLLAWRAAAMEGYRVLRETEQKPCAGAKPLGLERLGVQGARLCSVRSIINREQPGAPLGAQTIQREFFCEVELCPGQKTSASTWGPHPSWFM